MSLTLGLSILVSGAFGIVQVAPVQAPAAAYHAPAKMRAAAVEKVTKKAVIAEFASAVMASPPDPAVEKAVEAYFSDIPIMVSIAGCESKFHQYNLAGGILTSITGDLGVMQINAADHTSEAADMGLDLKDLQDNMAFARYLYEQQGTDPWLSSAHCWGSQNTATRNGSGRSLAVRK